MGYHPYMDARMAERLDPVFPEAGGLQQLGDVQIAFMQSLPDPTTREGSTLFHPARADHVRKALTLLGDDVEAKSTLMSLIAFAQMKNDVAGF